MGGGGSDIDSDLDSPRAFLCSPLASTLGGETRPPSGVETPGSEAAMDAVDALGAEVDEDEYEDVEISVSQEEPNPFVASGTATVKKRCVGGNQWSKVWVRNKKAAADDPHWNGSEPWLGRRGSDKSLSATTNDVAFSLKSKKESISVETSEAATRCVGCESADIWEGIHPSDFPDQSTLEDDAAAFVEARLRVPRKPPCLWAREARTLHQTRKRPLPRGAGGLLAKGMFCTNPPLFPTSWRPARLLNVSVDSLTTNLHSQHGDVEPIWLSVSCYTHAPPDAGSDGAPREAVPVKVCETFWTSFYSGTFRPDDEEYDSRKEPKACLLHIPHDLYVEGTPCFLVVKAQRLFTDDDQATVADLYKQPKPRPADAARYAAKVEEAAASTWKARVELGWVVVPLCGGEVGWRDRSERSIHVDAMWKSARGCVVPAAACFQAFFAAEREKKRHDKLTISFSLRVDSTTADTVRPVPVEPAGDPETTAARTVRHCSVSGVVTIAVAPTLPFPPLPCQQLRNELYVRLNRLSLHKTKIKSIYGSPNLIVEVTVRVVDDLTAPPLSRTLIDKNGRGLVDKQYATISPHQKDVVFDDEFTVLLPQDLDRDLHLFFTVFHIQPAHEATSLMSVLGGGKKSRASFTVIGHSVTRIAPNGFLVREKDVDLPVYACAGPCYAKMLAGTVRYLPVLEEVRDCEKEFCDDGKPALFVSLVPRSSLHPNQGDSSAALATLLQTLQRAVRCDDPQPPPLEAIPGIEVEELLRFLPAVANLLFALLCKTPTESVLDSILTIFCRIVNSDASSLTWYCETIFSNNLLMESTTHCVWKHLLRALSEHLVKRRIWTGLAFKDVHRSVYQIVLRSLLLSAPLVEDECLAALREMSVSLGNSTNAHPGIPPAICGTWGELLADLVGILPGPELVGIAGALSDATRSVQHGVLVLSAFVARVGNPLPLASELAALCVRVCGNLSAPSPSDRDSVRELLGDVFSTSIGATRIANTQQYRHVASLFKPLRPVLLKAWDVITATTAPEKRKLEVSINTYREQVSSMRKFAQSTAECANFARDTGASSDSLANSFARDPSTHSPAVGDEYREKTTAIATTIVAKQTALADVENKLDSLARIERSELRQVALLYLCLVEGSDEWTDGTVDPSELVKVLPLLPQIAELTCTYAHAHDRTTWGDQVADHAGVLLLRMCLDCSSAADAAVLKAVVPAAVSVGGALVGSHPTEAVRDAALGLVTHIVLRHPEHVYSDRSCVERVAEVLMHRFLKAPPKQRASVVSMGSRAGSLRKPSAVGSLLASRPAPNKTPKYGAGDSVGVAVAALARVICAAAAAGAPKRRAFLLLSSLTTAVLSAGDAGASDLRDGLAAVAAAVGDWEAARGTPRASPGPVNGKAGAFVPSPSTGDSEYGRSNAFEQSPTTRDSDCDIREFDSTRGSSSNASFLFDRSANHMAAPAHVPSTVDNDTPAGSPAGVTAGGFAKARVRELDVIRDAASDRADAAHKTPSTVENDNGAGNPAASPQITAQAPADRELDSTRSSSSASVAEPSAAQQPGGGGTPEMRPRGAEGTAQNPPGAPGIFCPAPEEAFSDSSFRLEGARLDHSVSSSKNMSLTDSMLEWHPLAATNGKPKQPPGSSTPKQAPRRTGSQFLSPDYAPLRGALRSPKSLRSVRKGSLALGLHLAPNSPRNGRSSSPRRPPAPAAEVRLSAARVAARLLRIVRLRGELAELETMEIHEEVGVKVLDMALHLMKCLAFPQALEWLEALVRAHQVDGDFTEAAYTHVGIGVLLLKAAECILQTASGDPLPANVAARVAKVPWDRLLVLFPYFSVFDVRWVELYAAEIRVSFVPSLSDVVVHFAKAVDLFTKLGEWKLATTIKDLIPALDEKGDGELTESDRLDLSQHGPSRALLRRVSLVTVSQGFKYCYIRARLGGVVKESIMRIQDIFGAFISSRARVFNIPVTYEALQPSDSCSMNQPSDMRDAAKHTEAGCDKYWVLEVKQSSNDRTKFYSLHKEQPELGARIVAYFTEMGMPCMVNSLQVKRTIEEYRTGRYCLANAIAEYTAHIQSTADKLCCGPAMGSSFSDSCLFRMSTLLNSLHQAQLQIDDASMIQSLRAYTLSGQQEEPVPPAPCSVAAHVCDVSVHALQGFVSDLCKALESCRVFISENEPASGMCDNKMLDFVQQRDEFYARVDQWQSLLSVLKAG
ncbi:hypothetical protein DIPPA_35289 [Diplonema papillatum]|nr:hypothetical protein DIPPA_35289 [Diplonema papillatum]